MRVNPTLVLLFLVACKDKEASKPAPVKPPAVEPQPVEDAADTGDLPPIRSFDDTGPGAVTIAIEGASTKLTWGIAFYGLHGLDVTLLGHKTSCAERESRDARAGGVNFVLSPGPEGKYYAGLTIGVEVVLTRVVQQVTMAPDQVSLKLEEFQPLVAGAHLKGTIEGDAVDTAGHGTVKGTFDVEICNAPETRVSALRAKAPIVPVTGKLETVALAPKSVHAILGMHGTRPFIAKLAFYEQADAPCPSAKPDAPKPMFELVSFATTKTPTPVGGAAIPGGKTFDAWIAFDSVALEPGEHVKGKLWAQPSFTWADKGEFGGTFDATVCGP